MKWRVGSIKNRSAHAAHIVRVFLWESKGCGLSPQGYAPWGARRSARLPKKTQTYLPGRVALGRKAAALRLPKNSVKYLLLVLLSLRILRLNRNMAHRRCAWRTMPVILAGGNQNYVTHR